MREAGDFNPGPLRLHGWGEDYPGVFSAGYQWLQQQEQDPPPGSAGSSEDIRCSSLLSELSMGQGRVLYIRNHDIFSITSTAIHYQVLNNERCNTLPSDKGRKFSLGQLLHHLESSVLSLLLPAIPDGAFHCASGRCLQGRRHPLRLSWDEETRDEETRDEETTNCHPWTSLL